MIQFNKLTASRDIPALLTLFPVPKPEASYGSQAKNSCRKSKMSKRAKSKETISTSESDESGDDRKVMEGIWVVNLNKTIHKIMPSLHLPTIPACV